MARTSLLLFILLTIIVLVQAQMMDVVKTDKGYVRGRLSRSALSGKKYVSFRGIPYAKPPVGQLRFRPPVESDSWDYVLLAINDPKPCAQFETRIFKIVGDEDCLYLNVHTPRLDSNDIALRPVMFWIHYGAFLFGSVDSNFWGPDYLIEEDVVVVAANYRLGALGFLSLGHEDASGNAGLKDQVLAMKWVQKNIRSFGGDPDKVTIFGDSSGAASVELHKLSDSSRGLFRASIAMSGSPLNSWGFHTPQEAEKNAFRLGRYLGIKADDKRELLDELYRVDSFNIVAATNNIVIDMLREFKDPIPFRPTLEVPLTPYGNYFLTECPVQKYRTRRFIDAPHMLGFTRSEGLAVIRVIGFVFELLGKKLTDAVVNPLTDFSFVLGIDRTQKYLTTYGTAPVYYYRNSFDYEKSLHQVFGRNNLPGTAHGDDVAHLFHIHNSSQTIDPMSDIGVHRKKMAKLWTNFAKYLDPTPLKEADPLLQVDWLPSGSNGLSLEIDKTFRMQKRPINKRILRQELNHKEYCN